MQDEQFITDLLKLVNEYDCHSELYWDEDLNFFVVCNDVFVWGASDAEDVTAESLPELKRAFEDAGEYDGIELYCARARKMRPQGAMYQYIQKVNWPLFDACGPERKAGMGNPKEQPN